MCYLLLTVFLGFGPGASQYCCSGPSNTFLFPSWFKYISTHGGTAANPKTWQEFLAGLSQRISTLQFPSLSMTEVPIPSTDDGGEQRGRTRGNLPLRLVLGIIQNLYWLSAKQKMERTGTNNRQEKGEISIRPRRFEKNFFVSPKRNI